MTRNEDHQSNGIKKITIEHVSVLFCRVQKKQLVSSNTLAAFQWPLGIIRVRRYSFLCLFMVKYGKSRLVNI